MAAGSSEGSSLDFDHEKGKEHAVNCNGYDSRVCSVCKRRLGSAGSLVSSCDPEHVRAAHADLHHFTATAGLSTANLSDNDQLSAFQLRLDIWYQQRVHDAEFAAHTHGRSSLGVRPNPASGRTTSGSTDGIDGFKKSPTRFVFTRQV